MVADVPKIGVGGLLESESAVKACPLVLTVSLIDVDVGGIVGVVGYADGTSELRSAGWFKAIGIHVTVIIMWPLGDVGS